MPHPQAFHSALPGRVQDSTKSFFREKWTSPSWRDTQENPHPTLTPELSSLRQERGRFLGTPNYADSMLLFRSAERDFLKKNSLDLGRAVGSAPPDAKDTMKGSSRTSPRLAPGIAALVNSQTSTEQDGVESSCKRGRKHNTNQRIPGRLASATPVLVIIKKKSGLLLCHDVNITWQFLAPAFYTTLPHYQKLLTAAS